MCALINWQYFSDFRLPELNNILYCKIVQFPISPNIHTNESQTAQTCLVQYSLQNDFCICGLKIFEKVATQIEIYPVQMNFGGSTV
jgi:hypothetical protein